MSGESTKPKHTIGQSMVDEQTCDSDTRNPSASTPVQFAVGSCNLSRCIEPMFDAFQRQVRLSVLNFVAYALSKVIERHL